MSYIQELFKPLDINKYVPKTSDVINFRSILYSELETRRKRVCDYNGNTFTFYSSCFSLDTSEDGQMLCNVRYRDYDTFTTVSSLSGSPYSVKICNPKNSVDFQASDLEAVYDVIKKIVLCVAEECECSSCSYFEIPVWGGATKLRFTLIVHEDFRLGFNITEINDHQKKEYIRHTGYHFRILPPMRKMPIFVPTNRIRHFRAVIKRTYQVMLLQFEILAQQYAIYALFPMKLSQSPIYNKEDLYWLVLEIFYGLNVCVENMLPASFVLRDFLLQYLCDKYSLYYNPSCVCDFFRHMPNMRCPPIEAPSP